MKKINIEKFCWIGLKPSDVENSQIIEKSFLFYGKSKNISSIESELGKRENYNRPTLEQSQFLNKSMKWAEENNFSLLVHNPQTLINYQKSTGSKCKNHYSITNQKLIRNLQSKLFIKELFKAEIPFLKTEKIKKSYCSFDLLSKHFKANKIVLHSSNPFIHDDYVLTKESDLYIKKLLHGNFVLAQKYLENTQTISIQCAVSKNENYLFPPCICDYLEISDSFSHITSNFIAYNKIEEKIKSKVEKFSKIICDKLRVLGWKGIFGIEFLLSNGKLYLSKISTTFQATTSILNYSFKQKNLPSLQQIQIACFRNEQVVDPSLFNIDLNYFCFVVKNKKNWPQIETKPTIIFDKTYNQKTKIDSGAYLFTQVFDKEINWK